VVFLIVQGDEASLFIQLVIGGTDVETILIAHHIAHVVVASRVTFSIELVLSLHFTAYFPFCLLIVDIDVGAFVKPLVR